MLISKTIEIDMGHRVPNHKSKCRNIHGHRYKIEVGVDDKVIATPGSSDEGMVIDYGDLKDIMLTEISDRFDHAFVMWEGDEFRNTFQDLRDTYNQKIHFVAFIPTAERLARHWFYLIDEKLKARKIAIKYVKVWETPNSTAMFTAQDDD